MNHDIIDNRTEKLNEEAMYAIYEQKSGTQLSLFEDEEDVPKIICSEALL